MYKFVSSTVTADDMAFMDELMKGGPMTDDSNGSSESSGGSTPDPEKCLNSIADVNRDDPFEDVFE